MNELLICTTIQNLTVLRNYKTCGRDYGMNETITALKENIAKVMIGKEETVDLLLTALIAGGHVLLEDVPGMGKTVLAKALSKSMDMQFGRIQFTPDLLPSDVTGLSYYNQEQGKFVFRKGPVFTNLLLADEINRATPRTQSSLLECMGEGQVTVDGNTRNLEQPFFVIATQNPVETLGCFPLPEAQMDRFMMKISMGKMQKQEEREMIDRYICDEPLQNISPVCGVEEISKLQQECRNVFVHNDLRNYMVELVQASRSGSTEGMAMRHGVSPRGTLSLLRGSQGYALVQGRDYVVPEDIKAVAVPVLAHRLLMETDDYRQKVTYIQGLLQSVAVPTEDWKRA